LPKDLNLDSRHVAILYGTMSDIDQQQVVEDFGKEKSPIRLLIASDVASEGINLHYLSHRLIHFDIPWSLMVFQQRNGRIDRYGQRNIPYILYLVSQCSNPKIKGDMRILELLIEKDEEAVKNIGDPSAIMGVYDIDLEERITAEAIEQGTSASEFEKKFAGETIDPLALMLGETAPPVGNLAINRTREILSLYPDDYHYLKAAIESLKQSQTLQTEFDDDARQVTLTATKELKSRLRNSLPREVWPKDDIFILSADTDTIQDEIRRSRKDEKAWPRIHYLWPHNPVIEWINDKVIAGFGRHEAPVLSLPGALEPEETVFILSGLIPNRKGHPLVFRWFGVTFLENEFLGIESFDDLLERTGLGRISFPNSGAGIDVNSIKKLLPDAVKQAKEFMSRERAYFENEINDKLQKQLDALELLKGKQYRQLDLFYMEKRNLSKKERRKREIDRKFDEFIDWVEDTMTTEDNPYIQIVAVLKGGA
jgi:hypothetical protein